MHPSEILTSKIQWNDGKRARLQQHGNFPIGALVERLRLPPFVALTMLATLDHSVYLPPNQIIAGALACAYERW